MKFSCPVCHRPLLPEAINVQTDLALCKACGQVAKLSELPDADFDSAAVSQPPPGVSYQETTGGHVVRATTRHPMAFFMVPFTLVWAGGSMTGLYGTQIATGKFNPLISLFGLPFLAGSVFLTGACLMVVCGQVEVRVSGVEGSVFAGVGPLGWRRRFNLDEVDSIEDSGTRVNYPGSQGASIVMRGRTVLRFGTNLSEPRRYFILNVLRRIKAQRGGKA
jgi:hypothetical protein